MSQQKEQKFLHIRELTGELKMETAAMSGINTGK